MTDPDVPGLDIQQLDIQPIQTNPKTSEGTEKPGIMSKAWHAFSDPLTDAPSRWGKSYSDYITDPNQSLFGMHETGQGGLHDYAANTLAKLRGFEGGAAEGLGNIASSLTSPAAIGAAIATGGESIAAREGLPAWAQAFNWGGKALGAPIAVHGASSMLSPDSTLQERAQGAVELAAGGASMMHAPMESKITEPTASTEEPTPSATEKKDKILTTKKVAENASLPEGTVPPEGLDVQPLPSGESSAPLDRYAKYRSVPVGTKYIVSPSEKLPTTIADAKTLGFEYQGLDPDGKLIIQKVRDSPMVKPNEPLPARGLASDVVNLPRTMMASMDVSAPLRQGLGLIGKKAFWTSLQPMFKAFGNEEFYNQAMDSIAAKPLFRRSIGADGSVLPSFAERAGLKLSNMLNQREESLMSGLLDKVPGFGGSERAYTLFLNKLRADTFEQMVNDFGVFSGQKANLPVAKQIADFVNNASGRGSLTATVPFTGGKQVSLENSANALASVLFSPRLIASRLQMMGKGARALFDPQVYMSSNPNIRREYLKSLFSIAATAGTFLQLSRMAGASVESNPASADFGKAKFGNTRIDPWGGFQQYLVLAQRLMPQLDLSSMGLDEIGGKMKSTMSGKEYSLDDPGFGRSNRADILTKFVRSKTNPLINFAWGMLAGQKEAGGKRMQLGYNPDQSPVGNLYNNSIAQRFIPMFTQDVYDLINDETTSPAEKSLAAFMGSLGAGVQTYGNERQR
jgi:hypothetical protein